jgi:hypothetical protein
MMSSAGGYRAGKLAQPWWPTAPFGAAARNSGRLTSRARLTCSCD